MSNYPGWRDYVPPGLIRPDGRVQRTEVRSSKYKVRSTKDDLLLLHCRALKLPEPEREFYFARPRRFRFDYAWPADGLRMALEVQGGLFLPGGGRHNRGAALLDEHEKLNLAASLGWRVTFTTPADVQSGAVWTWLAPMLRED